MERIMEARTHVFTTVVCILPFSIPYQKAFIVIVFATMVHAFSIWPITPYHYYLFTILPCSLGFPCGSAAVWLRICLQCGRPGFHPWVGKIPWRRERLPTPIFWPREFHGLYPWGHKESDPAERLSVTQSLPVLYSFFNPQGQAQRLAQSRYLNNEL